MTAPAGRSTKDSEFSQLLRKVTRACGTDLEDFRNIRDAMQDNPALAGEVVREIRWMTARLGSDPFTTGAAIGHLLLLMPTESFKELQLSIDEYKLCHAGLLGAMAQMGHADVADSSLWKKLVVTLCDSEMERGEHNYADLLQGVAWVLGESFVAKCKDSIAAFQACDPGSVKALPAPAHAIEVD